MTKFGVLHEKHEYHEYFAKINQSKVNVGRL